jgi:hypothetical protein
MKEVNTLYKIGIQMLYHPFECHLQWMLLCNH